MKEQFQRTEMLLGSENMEKLYNARVAVFGVGGVGGYVVEALARSGVGYLDLIDNDTVALSNLNRQIIATMDNIGESKVDVAKKRVLSINPEAIVTTYKTFYMPDTRNLFDFSKYDYVVDAIDTVTGKIELIMQANEAGVPIISSMGAGNKLHPELFEVTDIYKTSVCPLAKVMRRELKTRGIKKLKVVYSKEEPLKPIYISNEKKLDENTEKVNITTKIESDKSVRRKAIPGSNAFVPSAAGLIIAGEVIRDLTGLC